jgi:bacterioferritin-associated ferredoxin
MTLRQFRENYPFIAYGDEYHRWKKIVKYYKWLFDRLHTEGPTQYTVHDWRKLHCEFEWHVKNFNWLFRNLPKPTKEQYNRKCNPFAVGKWPEDSLDAIEKFIAIDAKCRKCAEDVAAILTKNDYQVNVLKMKQYESNKVKSKKKMSK